MKRKTASILLVLTAALSSSSCLALAGVGVGYIISREELANSTFEARVRDDVENVWPLVQEAFEILHDPRSETVVVEEPRRIEGQVDYSKVTIHIDAYDLDLTVIRVQAASYGTADRATAQEVLEYVLDRLSDQPRHSGSS